MPLKSTTTVEYDFNNAYLIYCKDHNCFRVSDNHEDSVLLNGVTPGNINNFIESYFEYVLKDEHLVSCFKSALKQKEAVEDE